MKKKNQGRKKGLVWKILTPIFALLTAGLVAAIPITQGYSDIISNALHAQTRDHIFHAGDFKGNIGFGSHQMVGGAPVAQTADVDGGFLTFGDSGHSGGNGGGF